MRWLGGVLGILFGGFFSAAGGFIALETAVPVYTAWKAAQTWSPTQGIIIEAGGEDNGVTARYRYQVGNRSYVNDRVHLADFKDNIGSYHIDMRTLLRDKLSHGEPVTVWFNPQEPGNSVIDRDMRWGLFALMTGFCSVFMLIGLVVVIAGFRGGGATGAVGKTGLSAARDSWQQAQSSGRFSGGFLDYIRSGRHLDNNSQQPSYSDASSAPWKENPAWQGGPIRSTAKRGMVTMWIFALLWNGLSSPIFFFLGDELKQENYPALLGLLFPIVGLFLIKKAWGMSREWNRYGVIELQLDPFPGAIGGHVGGHILINDVYQSGNQYQVELSCVYSYVSGSGKNRSRRENVLWSETGLAKSEVATSKSGLGTGLSFRFSVPDNLPESALETSGDFHLWRIKLTADLPDIDLDREYQIPVFKGVDKASTVHHDLSRQAEAEKERLAEASQMALSAGQFDQTALSRSVRFLDQAGITRFYYPMFRNKGLTLFALVFAAGFDFATYSMVTEFSDGVMGIVSLLFSLPFAVVGLIATIAVLYLPLNNLRVVIGNGSLQATRRLFVIPIKRNVVATYDIEKLQLVRSGSSGRGGKMVEHYKIKVHTKSGKKITIAEDVDGEVLANQFKWFLEKRLGLSSSRPR